VDQYIASSRFDEDAGAHHFQYCALAVLIRYRPRRLRITRVSNPARAASSALALT
jgi:hypothetical protein